MGTPNMLTAVFFFCLSATVAADNVQNQYSAYQTGQGAASQNMVQNHEFGKVNSTHYNLVYRQVTRDQWQQAEVKQDAESLTAFGEIVMARDEEQRRDSPRGGLRHGNLSDIHPR